jgi:inhibitor of KinA
VTGHPPPRFLDAGETALVQAILADPVGGILETVPTYRSLMIHYDPLRISRAALAARVAQCLDQPRDQQAASRLWHVPACYDAEFAEDLAFVAAASGLDQSAVISSHAGATYTIAMMGFAPGWAYLGGLPEALALPRRLSPRARIPAGSLIIAGGQAIVATMAMPSGWHILGRTPIRLFDPARDPPFVLSVGDRLVFDPVSRAAFDEIAASGSSKMRCDILS